MGPWRPKTSTNKGITAYFLLSPFSFRQTLFWPQNTGLSSFLAFEPSSPSFLRLTTVQLSTSSLPPPPPLNCWKSAPLAGKRIRFGTNRVTISEPTGWNHRRVIQLPLDLHSIHTDIHCVYLILSLFPTGYEPGCTLFSVTVPQDSTKSRLAASRPAATRQLLQDQLLQ
jgi:hypothetical protein